MTRIGLCDCNDLFRKSIASLLRNVNNIDVSFSVSTVQEVLNQLSKENTDILIIETAGMSNDECQLIKRCVHNYPSLRIFVLSEEISKQKLSLLLRCGIAGYYSKSISTDQFLEAIEKMIRNRHQLDVHIGPVVREKLSNEQLMFDSYSYLAGIELTKREVEILNLICAEKSNAEISDILSLSIRTVETHRRRMIEKTNSKNIVGVIIQAIRKGLPLAAIQSELKRENKQFGSSLT